MTAPRSSERRVRLYHQLRTAHLERAAQLPAATLVYGSRRYDFDERLAAEADLVQVSNLGAAWWFFTHDVGTLEVNEPLYRQSVRLTASALLGLGLRRFVHRSVRSRVVSYAIENLDPSTVPPPTSIKSRAARRIDLRLARRVWRRLDRLAFGTAASADLYAHTLPRRKDLETRIVPALPVAVVEADDVVKRPGSVVFLGAFDERKGVGQVLSAWPRVRQVLAESRLLLLGKGPLTSLVRGRAAVDTTMELIVDPSRDSIRDALRESQVLVLPSRRTRGWREQVGLPIVEGLSYGCTIVCTAETGLATWLRDHGHHVLDAGREDLLAAALVQALKEPLPVSEVLASLPRVDGRLDADAWLFSAASPPGDRSA